MKEHIRDIKFRSDKLARIQQIVEVVKDYQQQGLVLSARQLYYQLVRRNWIVNDDAEYKKLTATLTDARYAGLVDWDAIEDRGRRPSTPAEFDDPADLMQAALRSYRLPRWKGQNVYVELWVEKEALAGVLAPLASEYHVTLSVNKGYSSASAMYEAARRIKDRCGYDSTDLEALRETRAIYGRHSGQYVDQRSAVRAALEETVLDAVILYLGDHDPSGEDMVRDISARLTEFDVVNLKVEKIALTMAQIRQYKPPHNPAKVTDPRAGAYIAKYGRKSWEVDALPPQVLAQIIRTAFSRYVNKPKMNAIKAQEEKDLAMMRKAVANIMKKR